MVKCRQLPDDRVIEFPIRSRRSRCSCSSQKSSLLQWDRLHRQLTLAMASCRSGNTFAERMEAKSAA